MRRWSSSGSPNMPPKPSIATMLPMAPSVEGAGVALNAAERGSGPAVLLVHGMASDALALEPIAKELSSQARVIAYDRRGYGSSGAPEPHPRTTGGGQGRGTGGLVE